MHGKIEGIYLPLKSFIGKEAENRRVVACREGDLQTKPKAGDKVCFSLYERIVWQRGKPSIRGLKCIGVAGTVDNGLCGSART